MEIHYTEDGNIKIKLTTIEDRIIWKKLFYAEESGVHFKHSGFCTSDTFIAKPIQLAPVPTATADQSECTHFVCTPDHIGDYDIPQGVSYYRLKEYKAAESKLNMVKYIREITDWGIRDTKEYVDKIWDLL